jgi:biofilm PGA synthesis N-glycosyltransferase PgaC
MRHFVTALLNPFLYWLAWIIIPLIMEVIPAFGSFFLLIWRTKHLKDRASQETMHWPEIVLIVPVYNSEASLEKCLASIYHSTYPNDRMQVYLVNNHTPDNSFAAFSRAQKTMPDLRMQWLNADQGKSRALNLAIYNSEGKYIINIDSDGALEPSALERMVRRFESDTRLDCQTGTVLTAPEEIMAYPTVKARLLRRLEFCEYAQAFMAGRNYASAFNAMYTLSGAFSAFRIEAIRSSHLYNTETISEDTEITFQMKYLQHQRVEICPDAIFFTGPIEDMNKLYIQRQRWQRGSLEVARMYPQSKLAVHRMFSDVNVKTMMYDHTFAFPRLIWYLALIFLLFIGYSSKLVLVSMGAIFAFYIACGYLYYAIAQYLMKPFEGLRRFYLAQWPVIALLPFFNFMLFFVRFAGVINSIGTESSWRTRTLTEEKEEAAHTLHSDMNRLAALRLRLVKAVNNDDTDEEEGA